MFYYVVVYFSHSFHKNIDFLGSLVLYICKISVGSVSKILLVLTQSLYVVYYKRSTLQAQVTFLLQQSRTIIVISQLHYHRCMYFIRFHSITHVGCLGM